MKKQKSRTELWNSLISKKRLFEAVSQADRTENRSVFDMDHDRVVYSNYFRRMHDKTQVFPYAPLSPTSQARSRLSHSLEVSCVGRSLGTLAGSHLVDMGVTIIPYDLGSITATACLAHDIGNPPFGHAGEDAIREWSAKNITVLEDPWERDDILNFEGNAQGFRILTRLEAWQRKGGLRTTVTTLAAFTKYPCSSINSSLRGENVSEKKHGFFKDDLESFNEVYSSLSIPCKKGTQNSYPRHPLAFLTEAADDICYAIVDLEDAFHLGIIPFSKIQELILPIAQSDSGFEDDPDFDEEIRLSRYRSAAISALVHQATETFAESLEAIESFNFDKSLIKVIRDHQLYENIKSFSLDYIYTAQKVMEIESAGFRAITGLLDIFIPAILSDSPTKEQSINRHLIPKSCLKRRDKIVSSS